MIRTSAALVLVVLLGYFFVGCGQGDDGRSGPIDTGRPIEGALGAIAATGDDLGAAIVRSADDGDGPETSLRIVGRDGRQRSISLDSDAPLYAVKVWTTPSTVGVLGARCSPWVTGDAPRWVDGTGAGDNVRDNCNGTSYVLWLSDRDGGGAKTIELSELKASNGYQVVGVRGDRVLLLGQGEDSGYVVLDPASGGLEELPEQPSKDGIAEATFTPCLDTDGDPFGVFTWMADVPHSITTLGWDRAPSKKATVSGQSVAVGIPTAADGWKLIEVAGTFDGFNGVSGCGPDGAWSISSTGATVDVVDGVAKFRAVPALPPGEEVSAFRLGSLGAPLAVTQSRANDAPDEPRAATGHVLKGNRWQEISTPALGSGSVPFRNGEVISSLSPNPNAAGLIVRLR